MATIKLAATIVMSICQGEATLLSESEPKEDNRRKGEL
jgi:hypothetical protein